MDTTTFDRIARTLSGSTTRRGAVRGLFAGAAAAIAGGALLRAEDASARRRRKKNKKGKKGKKTQKTGNQNQSQLLPPGSPCESSTQCTSTYICEVPVNGSNSDRYCSGGHGAICGAPNGDGDDTAPFCAVGFDCVFTSGGYTCQAVPDEI